MAVAFVASASNAVAPGTSITIAKPVGTIDGNIMLARFAISSTAASVATLAGWTPLRDDTSDVVLRQQLFYKIADTEPVNYTWTVSSSFDVIGDISSYSGTPVLAIDAHAATAFVAGTNPIIAPSIVAAGTDEMLVCFFAQGKGDQTFSTPAGMTEIVDLGSGGGSGGVCGSTNYEPRPAAGATGTRSSTMSGPGTKFASIGASILIMEGGGCLPLLAIMGVGCR